MMRVTLALGFAFLLAFVILGVAGLLGGVDGDE